MLAAFALGAFAVPLSRTLDRVLADPSLRGASVGVVVLDADGEVVYARDPDRRLVPASTAKLVTAVAAARELGLGFTFETAMVARGVREGTVLRGDLAIVGDGDPSFGEPDPRLAFEALVTALRENGVERVAGDLLVDPTAFDGPPLGKGWMWDDLVLPYSAPFGAANVAHNLLVAGLDGCEARDGPGSPLTDPPLCLARSLREHLVAAGIAVEGEARVGRLPPDAVPIAVLPSPPLGVLLRHMLVESDNLYAECIGLCVRPGIDELLADAGDAVLVDGSGLSRYSAVSAEDLARIAWWARTQPFGPDLEALLPVAGRDGTLAGRAIGTPAEGRVRAKTGSMTGVRNLVGYVDDADGRTLVVAFLVNGLASPQKDAIAVQDRALALLASSKRGRRVPREAVDRLVPQR